jgi:polysaccharide biosynthesis/export protein
MNIDSKNRIKLQESMLKQTFGKAVVLVVVLLAAAALWGADSAKSDGDSAAQAGKTAGRVIDSEYRIGPSDVLAINVWKDNELSRTVLVRPDGKISLPLIDELAVSGLTAREVQELIAQKLEKYVSKPQVTVIVTEVKSRTYTVVGKIAKPGSYELAKPTTVLEAIAIAGGFVDFAKIAKVYVIRRAPDGSQTRLPFDYKKVLNGSKADENIDLQSGDTIVIP